MGAYISYVDVVPSLLGVLERSLLPYDRRGYSFDQSITYPCVMVRTVGGTDNTRIQLIVRANSEGEAMEACINSANTLEQDAQYMDGVVSFGITMDSKPIITYSSDDNKPEAWCYLTLDHLES